MRNSARNRCISMSVRYIQRVLVSTVVIPTISYMRRKFGLSCGMFVEHVSK